MQGFQTKHFHITERFLAARLWQFAMLKFIPEIMVIPALPQYFALVLPAENLPNKCREVFNGHKRFLAEGLRTKKMR